MIIKLQPYVLLKSIIINCLLMPKVGASGYIAFYETNIHGDVLENFVPGFITQFIKLGKKLVFFYTLIIFSIFSSFPTLKRVEEGRDFGLSQNLCL